MVVTREEVLTELVRELAERDRLYPQWVAEGKYGYTEALAAHRMACLRQAIADQHILRHWLRDWDMGQPDFFPSA